MQNLGHCRAKQTFFRSVVSKMDEKQAVTFALISTFLYPQRATLTYSERGINIKHLYCNELNGTVIVV